MPFSANNQSRRKLTMAFVVALLQWTTTATITTTATTATQLTSPADDMTAWMSASPPGDTTPHVIEIGIGGSANITCRIVDGNISSSALWFYVQFTKTKVLQPSKEITILDPNTAVFTLRNAIAQKGTYTCMSEKNEAIGQTRVYVGTPPTDVIEFSCRGYDYEYMICNFTKPENMLYTTYMLNYTTDSDNQNYSFTCELQISDDFKSRYCKLTYFPSREMYYINLTAINALGTKSQFFEVNNHKNVIPAKLNITLHHITTDSVTLAWKMLKMSYYHDHGLEYEIQLQPKGFDWYYATHYEHCENITCNVTIKNLIYPYREYIVRVRVKVRTAKNDGTMWSEPYVGVFRTKPRRPDFPPRTVAGGFYIESTETQLRLYWQKLWEYEHNGPGFHYLVNETDALGVVLNTTRTNNTSITFPWRRSQVSNYLIQSINDLGDSLESNQMIIYPAREDRYRYSPHSIAAVYHNGTYTLSWKPPMIKEELVNYTVFWCLPKMESSNQCKDTINTKYLDKHATNFTTSPQDHTLNLAVSANYRDYNTGMHWAICSPDISSELMKLEPEVSQESATAIRVRWSSERVCTSILKGYNLTYCQLADSPHPDSKLSDCVTPERTIVLLREQKEYKQFVIENLKPFSNYRVNIFMYSDSKVGPTSDTKFIKTKEAAPSAPRNLSVDESSVTSKSAIISWLPSEETNGLIQYYTICKIKNQGKDHKAHKDYQYLPVAEIDTDGSKNTPIVFKLEALNSFSEYEVYVTAHTVEGSEHSNHISFSTLIGIPSNPRNVTIEEDGNFGEISWLEPEMPSGRVEFYVVALRMTHKNADTNTEDVYEKIALVKERRCRYRLPECIDASYSYFLRVRAVNRAEKHEIDHSTFSSSNTATIAAKRRKRHTSPEISSTVVGGRQTYNITSAADADRHYYRHGVGVGGGRHDMVQIASMKTTTTTSSTTSSSSTTTSTTTTMMPEYEGNGIVDSDFQCIGAAPIEKRFSVYTKQQATNDVIDASGSGKDAVDYKYFSSPWENSQITYKCTEFSIDNIMTIAAVIFAVALFGAISLWGRKKFNKMKNIQAVLPEGLADHHMPNHKFSGSGHSGCYENNNPEKELSSEISASNDCLVFQQHKESHRLLVAPSPLRITTPALSLTAANSDKVGDDDQHMPGTEPHSLDLSNEAEHSSQSTDSVELNDVSSTLFNHSPAARNAKALNDKHASYQEAQLQICAVPNSAAVGGGGGYVTPSTLLFPMSASSQPAVAGSGDATSTFQMAPNGYVQPHSIAMLSSQQQQQQQQQQQHTNLNGYTTLDAMGKPVPVAPAPTVDLNSPEIVTASLVPQSKMLLGSYPSADESTPVMLTNNNNNSNYNHGNAICGYVTQRQLADFGQLLH